MKKGLKRKLPAGAGVLAKRLSNEAKKENQTGQRHIRCVINMRTGLKSQSRVRHQRAVGRYQSSCQRGGSIAYGLGLCLPYQVEPWMARRRQKGGLVQKVVYLWMTKGRKYKRRRKQA